MTRNITIENTSTNGKQAHVTKTTRVPVKLPNGLEGYEERSGTTIIIGNGAKLEFVITDSDYLTLEEID